MIGRSLGRYRLQASLGRGGMAEVFRAQDERLDRAVAVKVILPAFASDAQFAERFLREARLVAGLEHPHILPVYDFGEADGTPYLVMPLLEGGTLVERMADGPLAPAPVARWIREIAEALDAAHSQGVLHRDVKPANVLLDSGGRALLADFGIAKSAQGATQLTATGVVVGTPTYMAPELARGEAASPASDLYALGVVAYEMLAGAPPFRGESALSILHQHVSTPPPSVVERAALPLAMDRVFARVLAKRPEDRPRCAVEFARDLEEGLSSGAGTEPTIRTAPTAHMTTPVPRPAPAPAPPSVRPARSHAMWVVASLVLLASGVLLWRVLAEPPATRMDRESTVAAAPAAARTVDLQTASPSLERSSQESANGGGAAPASPAVAAPGRETPAADSPAHPVVAPPGSGDSVAPETETETVDATDRPLRSIEGRLRELQRRAAESSPREALAWFNAQLVAEGVAPGRAANETALAARRLWGAPVALQVLQQACREGISQACAELGRRPPRRP